MKSLDLGCGQKSKKEGSVGLDIRPAPHVDIVHDLNQYPYPFADNEFDHIEMSHIIEHIRQPLHLMNEVHRIAKDGATIRVITPHYTSQLSYGDLEHVHHLGYISFLTLQKTGLFKIEKHRLHFTDFYKILGVSLWANRTPRRWEKYFGFLLPALYVEVCLKVIKSGESEDMLLARYIY